MWTAYAADPAVPVPDLPSTTTLDDEVAEFATQIRRSIEFSGGATEDYFNLAGRAVQIGRSVPEGIQEAIRSLADGTRAARPHPRCCCSPRSSSCPGSWPASPQADHVRGAGRRRSSARTSRYPGGRSTSTSRGPGRDPTVAVRTAAVLTADYTGVSGWKRLESAVAEAAEVAALFDPAGADRRRPSS